jgi:GH25 family lysozyme M1 (1,4-beta-N-acetylmuramidase)
MATFAEQIAIALAERDRLKADYEAAESRYQALAAQAVKGGPDVSEFQGDIDWAKVKTEGWNFVFVRSSDGDYNDKLYTASRITAIRGAGLLLAPYHFARVGSAANGERDGRTEAAMAWYFARRQGWGKTGDLPLVYDFEGESYRGQTAAKAAKHLVEAVRTFRRIADFSPILYTSPDAMNFVGPALDDAGRAELAKCPLWIAHWGVTTPTVPAPWSSWTFWQYTDSGTAAGITAAKVDLSQFSGSKTDLDALRIS